MKWIGQHIYDLVARFRDDVYLEDLSTTTETNVLVVDSTGKVSKSTTLADDIIESEIDTLAGLTSFGSAGATTTILAGDLTMYNPVTDGNPTIEIGVDTNECLVIGMNYQSGTQSAQQAFYSTKTASGTADDGMHSFVVDGSNILDVRDGGIYFRANKGISIAGTDILTDSSGTATLSNIDALDATTIATFETAMESNLDTLSSVTSLGTLTSLAVNSGEESASSIVTLTNQVANQIALDINASNTTANVLDITADSVTTGNVIDISCDALTTGGGLFIDDNSAAAGLGGARSVAKIRQNNASAINATALEVISNGGGTGVLIDKNAAATDTLTGVKALHIDFDRTVPTSGTTAHSDIGIDLEVTSASLGASTVYGMDIDVVGTTAGTSQTAHGLDVKVSGADTNLGLHIDSSHGIWNMNSTTSSATQGGKITLVSNDGAAMGDDHRLGALEFRGMEDTNTTAIGAKIEAFADAAWSTTENGGRLVFSTTDADYSQSTVLTLDSDKLATFTGGITANNATTSSATQGGVLNLISDDGAALGDDHQLGKIGFYAAEDGSNNLQQGAYIRAAADAAWSASENGTRLEFYTMDGNASSELSLTLDSDKLATFTGAVTVTGTITGDVIGDVTGDVTGNASRGKGTRHYSSTIKILPSDFMINDDASSPLVFKDGSNSGIHVTDTANEAIAFVTIPEGMKATAVDIYATHNRTVKVYEVDLNASFDFTATADESGSANTQITVDPNINATATNYLAITVALAATTQRVWGGLVTIAAQ